MLGLALTIVLPPQVGTAAVAPVDNANAQLVLNKAKKTGLNIAMRLF